MRYLASMSLAILFVAAPNSAYAAEADDLAKEILKATGVKGGLIVHLGCGDGKLTSALRAGESFQVHGLDRDAANVQQARKNAKEAGVYGPVSFDRLIGKRLPYVDNLVNLVIQHDADGIPANEISRVLVPNGVWYKRTAKGWELASKPYPNNIDEWTHYLHDSTGNAVAHDDAVGPPRHLQWLGSPRWSRHHDRMASLSAMVSAGGRVFYIMDEGSRVSIQLPPKWKLIARDAFNGTVLWKQPIASWHSHLWPLKSGPTQLARRLVTTRETVYATLGFDAPLTALDAATGKVLRTYKGTKGTEEILESDGKLFLLVNKGLSELAKYKPQLNVGDQQRVGREFQWNQKPREIVALDAGGSELWRKRTRVSPLTLAADAKAVYFHDGEKVVCLNRTTGKEVWSSAPVARREKINFNFGPKLVIYKQVVLYAGGDRSKKNTQMIAFAADTGKQLWSAPHDQSAYASPEDLLVAGGLVWSAPTTRTGDSGVFTGRDPLTGEVKTSFPPNVKTYWFHHRCHIAKATDKFLLPSRTGIEFVDPAKKNWDINHWVRGGCLYGIMPCNGLVYAPPHNCACYPEAKLYGLNALAPATATRKVPKKVVEEGRLEEGPAYKNIQPLPTDPIAWHTYRHDAARSGFTKAKLPTELKPAWQAEFGGRLSAVTLGNMNLYVAQVDTHTVHALSGITGKKLWSYTAGGRVDSPPTIFGDHALFGSADGYVYCLRASDGELIWRFRAAPRDERLMAYEQLESVWPVHGSVLVRDTTVYFVAGRSNYLDGGLRLIRLNLFTGKKLSETLIDERDPETGKNLQERLEILQMPVGLPDILSSDGKHVYMRSQQFDPQGNRTALGPHSAQPAQQGSVQRGSTAHLFAPMGFLDGTYFHRSYWVYGRSFAGGHAGYYQAGKYAPSGRILVHDDENVYGFGRKAQYYRWTTTMEHQLFCTSKEPPPEATSEIGGKKKKAGPPAATMIRVPKSKSLNPTGQEITVEAWANSSRPSGVVLARGGPAVGYALVVRNKQPRFVVRREGEVSGVTAKVDVVGAWTHLVGVLTAEKLQLYVNGKLAATAKSPGLLNADPAQALEIGADAGGPVGGYRSPLGFSGAIDEVAVYHGTLTAEEIADHHANPGKRDAKTAKLVLAYGFAKGKAADETDHGNDGTLAGAKVTLGKVGRGMRFESRPSRSGGSFVKHKWAKDVPLLVRAMVLADKTLFIAGPPDLIDEEQTFSRLVKGDKKVQAQLAAQDAALAGKQGAILQAISATEGKKLAEYRLGSLPTWDGMAAAYGRLYLSTTDGKVVCFGGK